MYHIYITLTGQLPLRQYSASILQARPATPQSEHAGTGAEAVLHVPVNCDVNLVDPVAAYS